MARARHADYRGYLGYQFRDDAALLAQEKAQRNIRAMAAEHFPAHHADADEPTDQVELVGFATADMMTGHSADRLVPLDPDVCLGFLCPLRSDECDCCELAMRADEALDDGDDGGGDDIPASEVASGEPPMPKPPSGDDDGKTQYEEYPSAPQGRGKHATARKLTRFG